MRLSMFAALECRSVYLWFSTLSLLSEGSPHSLFKYFEIIKPHHISLREKRETRYGGQLLATFWAFQKHFSLSLMPDNRVIHPHATAYMVDNAGMSTPFSIHSNKFYTGTLDGDPKLYVDASETDGVWIAHIHTPEDLYAIEPLNFYDRSAHHKYMVIYRSRDIKPKNHTAHGPFCEDFSIPISSNTNGPQGQRVYTKRNPRRNQDFYIKRSKRRSRSRIDNKNTECDLLAIADYRFFKGFGMESQATTIQSLGHLYKLVDRIYRATDFGAPFFVGNGIVVHRFLIHSNFTETNHFYNTAQKGVPFKELVLSMVAIQEFADFCLVHLTTQRHSKGILGLASTATEDVGRNGGICASSANVGVSTIANIDNEVLSLEIYSFIVAHEIGHNWGAKHDPTNDPICSPSEDAGGKYLMYPQATMLRRRNSNKMSKCSKDSIKAILKSRAHSCFLSRSVALTFCGDGEVQGAEECDPGFGIDDPCCQNNCRLRDGAVCSRRNMQCCTEQCKAAPSSMKCYHRGSIDLYGPGTCMRDNHCPGNGSLTCPRPTPQPQGTPCGDRGKCWYGRCKSFCEHLAESMGKGVYLLPCYCDKDTVSMCMHCCQNITHPCQVMGPSKKDKSACPLGSCSHGHCKVKPNLKDDMWDILQSKSSSSSCNQTLITRGSCLLMIFLTWAMNVKNTN